MFVNNSVPAGEVWSLPRMRSLRERDADWLNCNIMAIFFFKGRFKHLGAAECGRTR